MSNDLCKFGHEISGIQGLRPEHLDRAEIIPRVTQMSAAREEHRQPRMLVTSAAAARSEGRKASWKILAWILSSNSHADQPGERRPGGEIARVITGQSPACNEQKNVHDLVLVRYATETRVHLWAKIFQWQGVNMSSYPDEAAEYVLQYRAQSYSKSHSVGLV